MDTEVNAFKHQQVIINGISTHLVETGNKDKQTILFLHGYPENWMMFEPVMTFLKDEYHLLAIDLPGVGKSESIASSDKLTIANFINDIIQYLNLKKIILVGHDVGGMITYSFIKHFHEGLSKAVIMSTAVPGVDPWEEVKRNPYIWHFAFFSVPALPESLISGRQHLLFDYFFNTVTANKDAISNIKRNEYVKAYESPISLKTSFDWYRTFSQDEKENSQHTSIDIPVLYLKGEKDYGNIADYLEGFKKSGLDTIKGGLIPNSGHFAPEEQPDEVAKAIDDFIKMQ
jgi:pimeloyl-ACP methyl ester carboxylesterase